VKRLREKDLVSLLCYLFSPFLTRAGRSHCLDDDSPKAMGNKYQGPSRLGGIVSRGRYLMQVPMLSGCGGYETYSVLSLLLQHHHEVIPMLRDILRITAPKDLADDPGVVSPSQNSGCGKVLVAGEKIVRPEYSACGWWFQLEPPSKQPPPRR